MTRDTIVHEISQKMTTMFQLDSAKITEQAHLFNDLGLDSLDAIDLVMQCQEQYKVEISNSDLRTIRTVKDIYDLVDRYVRSQKDIVN